MSSVEPEAQARRQLERVLESPGFARNDRMSRFLRFVVEQHLEDKDHELKESVIAIEVFGRPADFDPRVDPVVRTEAGRLRARLSEYYVDEGKGDPLVIELPKGGYIPRFREVEVKETREATAPLRSRLGTRAWIAAGLGGFAIAVALGWWRFERQAAPIAIAVLPLHNLSQDPANDYFADGLTDELIRNLSIIDGLAVRSQTSSFALKGKPNVSEAGQQLHADYVLEGSVLRAGQQLRINAQLVRVRDDFPVWSGRYDRELTDVLAIQDEISRGIVNSLRLKLGRGRRRYEISAEAHDLYLRARALEHQQGLRSAGPRIHTFEQAITKDPSFAPAYAGLATAYAQRSGSDQPDEIERAHEVSRMRVVVEKAFQLDPLLAEAHDAQGTVYARDAQWEQSEKSFRRALELDPNRSLTRVDFAMFLLLPVGRTEEAIAQVRLAEKADPLSPHVQSVLAYVLFSAGRIDEAAAHCQPRTECSGRALTLQGRNDEAIRILEAAHKEGAAYVSYLGYAYARAGRREDAEKIAALEPEPGPMGRARIFAGLGDKDRVFEALDSAIPAGPVRIGRDLISPEFAALRGDPRLRALRKKVGLPQ
jgi:TolB-like protein/Tfp pilus assembly protein PilF